MYNVISHQPLLSCLTTSALMSSPAHTRLNVSQAQVKHPVNTKKMHIPPDFVFENFTERAWFCCLVAGLGWGEAALAKACPHMHDVLEHATNPKEDERGNAQKVILELCWEKHDLSVMYLGNFLAAPGDCSVWEQTPAHAFPMGKHRRTTRCAQGMEHLSWPPGFLKEPFCTCCTAL